MASGCSPNISRRCGIDMITTTMTQPVPDLVAEFAQQEADYKETPLDLPGDPLALSWAQYHRAQQSLPYLDLAGQTPTPEDQRMADLCRRHYQDRILMRMLRGRELTPFQADLYQMLCTGARRKHEGMLHVLPYFYVEDQQRHALLDQFENPGYPGPEIQAQWDREENLLTLTPVQRIECRRSRASSVEYWFRHQEGWAVKWGVAANNPLLSIIQGLWDQSKPVQILARARWRQYYQMWHMLPVQPRLVLA